MVFDAVVLTVLVAEYSGSSLDDEDDEELEEDEDERDEDEDDDDDGGVSGWMAHIALVYLEHFWEK